MLSTLVLVFCVTLVLPGLVPGAMCAEGVFQAAGGMGRRAIFLRGAAVALLCLWHLLDRLNRMRPEAPLAVGAARALMAVAPVYLLAVLDTFRAFSRLTTHKPVSCCARVYDSFGSLSEAVHIAGLPEAFWLWALAVGTPVLLALAVSVGVFPSGTRARTTGLLALCAVFWVPAAAVTLVRALAAYHYEVLQHHCPWCLFLPEHGMVGYPLFFFLAVVFLEGSASWACSMVASRYPFVMQEAQARARKAGWRVVAAVVLFALLACLPAVVWRLRFGIWMG